MPTRFVCLANSYKEGGRCVAGILLDGKNNPVLENGRPKWIRPVSATDHGEVPTNFVSHIELLTILEVKIIDYVGEGHQSENVLFDEYSIGEVGKFPISNLGRLCVYAPQKIFGNKGKAVAEEDIKNLDHSLMLIRVTEFECFERSHEYKSGTTQIRLAFTYNKLPYEFTVTDPKFLNDFRSDPQCMNGVGELYLTLSLALKWQGWYHKLVAGVFWN